MHEENKNSILSDSDALTENGSRLHLLYEIGRVLASSATLNEAAPQILETIGRQLGFELGELWCLAKHQTVLHLDSVWHVPSLPLEKLAAASRQINFSVGEGLPGKVWERNAPVWIEDLGGKADKSHRFFVEEVDLQSGFAFPILLGEKLLGVIGFFCREKRAFDAALLEMFAAVGGSIAQFIQREHIETSLRASEDRYRAFISKSTEGIWRFELDEKISVKMPVEEQIETAFQRGHLAECNDAMAQMYGLEKAQDLVGSGLADLFDMSDHANIEYLRSFIESNYNLTDAESHEKDANGNDKYFLNSLVGTIENGYLIRVWGTRRDFTRQKSAEQALRVSEENFRAFMQASSQAIWTTDIHGQGLEAFGWWENQTGQTREQSARAGFLEAIHPDDRRRVAEIWKDVTAHPIFFETECRISDRNGDYRHFALRGVPVFNADGSFRQWIGTLTDITDRKTAEQSLKDNEERYRALVEATSTVVWRANENGELNFVGSQWENVSGQRVKQILGSGWLDALHPDDREKTIEVWQDSLAAKKIYETEFRVLTAAGEYRWFAVRGVPILNSDGSVREWIGANTDITDRKQAESRLAVLSEISEMTRTFDSADELLFEVSKILGEHLQVRRCLFNEIDLENDIETVHRDYCRGVESVAGQHRISDYSSTASAEMQAGKTVVNYDSKTDARTAGDYAKIYEPNGERAYITVPLLRENIWVASLWVSDDAPRRWSRQEISLLETVAERTWTAIEKLRINTALRASGEHLQLAVDISRISTFEIDLITDAVETDETGRAVYGFDIDEPLTFSKVQSHFHPDDRAEVIRRVEAAFAPDEEANEFEVEQRIIRTDGEVRWIRVRGRAFFEGAETDRRAVRCLGTYIDITDRKRAEEALRESQEVLSLAMQSSRMGAWSRDLTSEEVYWSAELEEIFGLKAGTFVGNRQGFYDYVYIEDKEYMAREVRIALNEHRSYIVEFRFHHADGSLRWMEGRGQGIYAPDGTPLKVYGIGVDITERKRAEAERERLLESERQARETAERANHSKDEFIALVSHELRSPLNAMLGWTRILQKKQADEKTTDYALDVIVRNARSQSRLIEDLLDIARIGGGKLRLEMRPTEIVPIIKAALESIKPTADVKNIGIVESLDTTANFISGDDDRLRQIVENLLSNAVKFTPEGGKIEITLKREGFQAQITVSDSGQGISAEFLPQIFERFKQADASTTRRHGGLGIGLSLARDLVELHGGTISAQSDGDGTGSTFIVTLPLRTVNAIKQNSDAEGKMNSQGKLNGFWILAVDDEADAREIVSFMLQINGAKVTTANSAVEALEILSGCNGRLPDILLSDISMPFESGYALVEKVRALPAEKGGQIPAVALTAFNRPEDREAAFEAGFQRHLGKPVDMDALIEAIIETAEVKQV